MTLQQLRYIVTIAESGSLSEAAKELFISQPSLSKALREIEQTIDRSLFLRTPRGMMVTDDGQEFLGYARQVLQQMGLLEEKYTGDRVVKKKFSISSQHYTFTANAFVELVKEIDIDDYEVTMFEGPTNEIIDNVKSMKSELGIIYLSDFNEDVISRILREKNLEFTPLCTVEPHVFLWKDHPLAEKAIVEMEDLEQYPCVTYDQGRNNSFYFSEELFSARYIKKHIIVSDRAAVVNFLIGLNAYTIGTGLYPAHLHDTDIISLPLRAEEHIEVGVIRNRDMIVSKMAEIYLERLKRVVKHIT